MKRKTVVRHVTLGALATGLVPLAAAGAAPAGESAAAVCRSAFGDRGPAGGRVVGEGPAGDPMKVSIGWDTGDWSGDQLAQIVTCVSVGGRAVPTLSMTTLAPPNTGSLTLDLTLPSGKPGSLVCQQSVLVGKSGDGRHQPTSPVCFKLRESGPAPAAPVGAKAPAETAPKPAPTTPSPASTPPARAAFEAAAGPKTPPVVRPAAPVARPVAPSATPKASAAPAPVRAPRSSTRAATATTTPATGAAAAPTSTLARTGINDHIPLAGAGGLLAIGGAAILFGEPRRRPRRA
jgi:hypothetical protein